VRETADEVTVRRVEFDRTYARVTAIAERSDRPAFVLVPGLSISVTCFELLAPLLGRHADVYAVELPGVAGVPGVREGTSVADAAVALRRVVDELGLVRPVLVGHSVGTQIVTEAAHALDPRALVLVAPVVDPARRTVPRTLGAFLRTSVHEPAAVVAIAVPSYLMAGPIRSVRAVPSLVSFELERALRRVRCPIRIVHGREDALASRSWLGALSRIGNVDVSQIPGAAHSVVHAHSREVARHCLAMIGVDDPLGDDVDDTGDGTDAGADAVRPRSGRRAVAVTLRLRVAEFAAMHRQDDAALERIKRRKLGAALAAGVIPSPAPRPATRVGRRR